MSVLEPKRPIPWTDELREVCTLRCEGNEPCHGIPKANEPCTHCWNIVNRDRERTRARGEAG